MIWGADAPGAVWERPWKTKASSENVNARTLGLLSLLGHRQDNIKKVNKSHLNRFLVTGIWFVLPNAWQQKNPWIISGKARLGSDGVPCSFRYGNMSAWRSAQPCHYSHSKSVCLRGFEFHKNYSRFVAVHLFSWDWRTGSLRKRADNVFYCMEITRWIQFLPAVKLITFRKLPITILFSSHVFSSYYILELLKL